MVGLKGIIIRYELLVPFKTINSNLYYQQLMRLKCTIEETQEKLIAEGGFPFRYGNFWILSGGSVYRLANKSLQ
ncbi:hypothetical protein EVAR_25706_1 [Eumeta japonica]|uniref:Uncharacterized protein n=1 Tax=Eumeta variegata TaxID=151549 RepID=A0A4C1YT63_EUMVA|nr:hypothetical protein EVAR_25706_1 [Eumeta japonica]